MQPVKKENESVKSSTRPTKKNKWNGGGWEVNHGWVECFYLFCLILFGGWWGCFFVSLKDLFWTWIIQLATVAVYKINPINCSAVPLPIITQSIKHNLNWRQRQKEREDETGSAHPQPNVWIFLFWSSLTSFFPTSCLGGGNRRFFQVEIAPSAPCFLIIPSYTWCFRTGWSIRQASPWEPHCTAAIGSPPVSSLLCCVDGTGWKVRWACWPCLEPHVCLQLRAWDSDQERELHKQVSLCTQFTQYAQGQLYLPLLLPYCVNPSQQYTVNSWVSVL